MPSIHFDITANATSMQKTFDTVNAKIKDTTIIIDRIRKSMKSNDYTDVLSGLNRQIQDNQEQIGGLRDKLKLYQDQAKAAFDAQNYRGLEDATSNIQKTINAIDYLEREVKDYKDAIDTLGDMNDRSVGQTNTMKTSQFFASKEDYDKVIALKQGITELEEKLASFQGSPEGLVELREGLSAMRDELYKAESKAADAADKLGSELGKKAADASKNVYELTDAVRKQEETLSETSKGVEEAKEALEKLRGSMDSDAIDQAIVKLDNLLAKQKDEDAELRNLKDSLEEAKKTYSEVNEEIDSQSSFMMTLFGGTENYNRVISALPEPLKKVVNGLGSMTKAAWEFIKTPIGAVVGALVIAFEALTSWFTKSSEGQRELAKISGYLSGVLGGLTDIAISVGEAIYNAFTKPGQAISSLGTALKNNIITRFQAAIKAANELGHIFQLLFTPSRWDELGQSFENFGNYLLDSTTGIENTADKFTNGLKDLSRAGIKNSAIETEKYDLERQEKEFETRKAEIEIQKRELDSIINDSSKSNASKKKALSEYQKLLDEEYEQEKTFADKRIELQQRSMALSQYDSNEEKDQLQDLMNERKKLESDYLSSSNRLKKRGNQFAVTPAEIASYKESMRQFEKQREELNAELYMEEAQAEIDALKDSSEKIRKQRELDHEKELRQIEKEGEEQKEAFINARKQLFEADKNNKNQAFNRDAYMQSDEYKNFANRIDTLVANKKDASDDAYLDQQKKEERDAMNEFLIEYGNYQEKREKIVEQYQERINLATTKGERQMLERQMSEAIAAVESEYKTAGKGVTDIFDDLSEKTSKELKEVVKSAQEALSILESGEWTEADAEIISYDQFLLWSKSPEKLEELRRKIKDVNDEAERSDNAINKMSTGLKKLFEAKDARQTREALDMINEGLSEGLQIAGFLSDTLSQLGDALGSGVLSGAADALNAGMDAVNQAMSGAQAGAAFGPWGAAAGAAIGLVGSLSSSLSKLHDAKHERKIQQIAEQIETLDKSYQKLGDSVEQAFSKDASNLIDQQNKLLAQQKVLIQQQIAEEEKKKKTDQSRIKEYKQQIADIDKLISDNEKKAVDAIFGEDVKSAINDFASAYASAWANNESRTESAKEAVKKMMQSMVTESIKAAIQSSSKMEEIRDKLKEFYNDNVLTGWEQDYIYKMASELQNQLDNQFGWADSLMGGSSSYSQQASSRGFQTMSQDTAEELNGRFTALQESGRNTEVSVALILSNMGQMMALATSGNTTLLEIRNLHMIGNGYLEDIRKYTKPITELGEKLDRIIDNTK